MQNDVHLKEEHNSSENEMISSINHFISTYLSSNSSSLKASKHGLSRASISNIIQTTTKLEEIRVALSFGAHFFLQK